MDKELRAKIKPLTQDELQEMDKELEKFRTEKVIDGVTVTPIDVDSWLVHKGACKKQPAPYRPAVIQNANVEVDTKDGFGVIVHKFDLCFLRLRQYTSWKSEKEELDKLEEKEQQVLVDN